jgi:hypothetical protein
MDVEQRSIGIKEDSLNLHGDSLGAIVIRVLAGQSILALAAATGQVALIDTCRRTQ